VIRRAEFPSELRYQEPGRLEAAGRGCGQHRLDERVLRQVLIPADALHRVCIPRAEPGRPDCGTTFTWPTRAFGPYSGWLGGWGIIAADVIAAGQRVVLVEAGVVVLI
jgi:hypothetical protein